MLLAAEIRLRCPGPRTPSWPRPCSLTSGPLACADSSKSPSAPFGPRLSRTRPRMHTLNIGILAHVDAGKTSLTERLLFDHGAIDRLGSVDGGDTRTDDGEIERERGITIRSAVAAFTVGDTQINLIDTPGHSDFIAEVERALEVLDGAVLLLSAVEGVQA